MFSAMFVKTLCRQQLCLHYVRSQVDAVLDGNGWKTKPDQVGLICCGAPGSSIQA